MSDNSKLDAKTKLRLAVVIFFVLVFVVGWGFVGAAVEEQFTGWGALAGLAVMGGLFVVGGMLYFFASHNKSVLNAVNQTDTKDEVAGLTKLAMAANQEAERASMRLWNQQRMWAEQHEKAMETQRQALAQQGQMLSNLMVAQQHTVNIVMAMVQSGGNANIAMPNVSTASINEPDVPSQFENPFSAEQIEGPTVSERVTRLETVMDRPNQKQMVLRESTVHRRSYGDAARFWAKEIIGRCWMKCELEIETLMRELGYKSRRGLMDALDPLADEGYCEPVGEQGRPRSWTHPAPPQPS